MEGILGKVKARDIIPGWPRGRSTSRGLAFTKPPAPPLWVMFTMKAYHEDQERFREWLEWKREERRKSAMMAGYYAEQYCLIAGQIPSTWDDTFRWWYTEGYQSEADRHVVRGYLP